MLKDQCISISELRTNTTNVMKSLQTPKYIFVNNKPKAVLIDIDQYEKEFESFNFGPDGIDPKEILDAYHKTYGR